MSQLKVESNLNALTQAQLIEENESGHILIEEKMNGAWFIDDMNNMFIIPLKGQNFEADGNDEEILSLLLSLDEHDLEDFPEVLRFCNESNEKIEIFPVPEVLRRFCPVAGYFSA